MTFIDSNVFVHAIDGSGGKKQKRAGVLLRKGRQSV